MFTGIVQAVGELVAREGRDDGQRLCIGAGPLSLDGVAAGDSIAVNGACLTVTGTDGGTFSADVSAESLATTTLGGMPVGAPLNLETPVAAGAPLGGHLVSGHVDGTGEVVSCGRDGGTASLRVRVPGSLTRYIARKGSVCVDGVSLTVNAVDGGEFEACLVPHTLEHTTLGGLEPGDAVNIEVDMIARYLERLV